MKRTQRNQLSSFVAIFTVAIAMLAPIVHASGPAVDVAHQVVVDGDQLRVTSKWYGHMPQDTWTFAASLPPGTHMIGRGGTLTLDPEDQRVVGIHFDEPPAYPLILELEIPWAEGDPIMALPLPPEPGWQRVEVEGNYRLIPDVSAAVPLHTTGYYGPGDLHVGARLRIDRRMDGRHPGGAAYLPGPVVSEAGGIPAKLESGAARKLGLGVAAGGVFICGLLVLTVVFRRSAAAVEVEDAQAYLDAEFCAVADADSSTTP